MERRFDVVFLEQAIDFMAKADRKAKAKTHYNLIKAKLGLDPKLFRNDKVNPKRTKTDPRIIWRIDRSSKNTNL